MKIISKINEIFGIKKVKEAEGAEVWLVSWSARYGSYFDNTKRVCKAFLTREDAEAYKSSLEEARSLLQNTDSIGIRIEKQE